MGVGNYLARRGQFRLGGWRFHHLGSWLTTGDGLEQPAIHPLLHQGNLVFGKKRRAGQWHARLAGAGYAPNQLAARCISGCYHGPIAAAF